MHANSFLCVSLYMAVCSICVMFTCDVNYASGVAVTEWFLLFCCGQKIKATHNIYTTSKIFPAIIFTVTLTTRQRYFSFAYTRNSKYS
jgi:hypothetical protein